MNSRVFEPGDGRPVIFECRGVKLGLAICEDIWFDRVPRAYAETDVDMLVVLNASPWRRQIHDERREAFGVWASPELPYLFVNMVGGQDELVFDGSSFSVDGDGRQTCLLPDFESGVSVCSFDADAHAFIGRECPDWSHGNEASYRACVLGLGDYVRKNGFSSVLIGLSGGIDSALTAAVAVDAIGAENVRCVMLPSRYTSAHSLQDAAECAERLGVRLDEISIGSGVGAIAEMLEGRLEGGGRAIALENIQSRLRGVTLMALSNATGAMLVTTGNKSEMAVGYATLYGDMCGGYNPLKDLYKTEVFAISDWRNQAKDHGLMGPDGQVIPTRILTKPPSAELREDQRDDDSLPPYETLDAILYGLVDAEQSAADLVREGFDIETVKRIEHLLYISEYKRRQSAPGPKIGRQNFGRDRRYPITNRFRSFSQTGSAT